VLKRFESNIVKKALFSKKDRLLLAFSGGVDSVVLAMLLKKCGYDFDLAHCNFQLRGKESDADEKFCKALAKKLKVRFYSKKFETTNYAQTKDLSIQMAARELRYNWFKSLLKPNEHRFILTAHHLNDEIETVLINLIRGTGIRGLRGIPEKQNQIVRPLLFASKEEILSYAKDHDLSYRHDSSNDEVKYKRNFLRLNVIPELKKLNPSLESTFENNIRLFNQAISVIDDHAERKRKAFVAGSSNGIHIDLEKLLLEQTKDLLLFEWLNEFGFNADQCAQLLESASKGSKGKLFYSASHVALINRDQIIVQKNHPKKEKREFRVKTPEDLLKLPVKIEFDISENKKIISDKNNAQLDLDKLHFPLTLRKWEKGDKFMPLGMKGFKKLSDLFTGEKLSLFDKEKIWVLCSKKDIVWVIGLRIDERYKVENETTRVLKLKYLN
jgi:tRNA(Ile)-lysidine synthase